MSVGAVLLQPQRVERAETATADDAALTDLVKLVVGVALDTARGGQVLQQLEVAGEAAATRLYERAESGLDSAQQRLASLLDGPLDGLTSKVLEFADIDSVDDALAAVHEVLAELSKLAEGLTIDHIRQHIGEIVDIIENDLGLTPDFITEQIWAFFDDFIDRLEHVAPESNPAAQSNRIEVIGALRRVKRLVGDEVEFPKLDVEPIAQALLADIRRTGIPDEAARAACISAGLAQAAQSTRSALNAVPAPDFELHGMGAGETPSAEEEDRTYLWYPSWLSNNHRPWWIDLLGVVPADSVWLTSAQQTVEHTYGRPDTVVGAANAIWGKDTATLGGSEAPYTFREFSPDVMEKTAWISAIVCNGLETLFHLISLEEGDYWSNIVNSVNNAGFATWKGIKKEPFPYHLETVLRVVLTFAATFEGRHTEASGRNKFWMWTTLAGPDFAEVALYKYFLGVARDFVLSVMTLTNHVPPADGGTHPRNREELDAIRNAWVLFLQRILLLLFPKDDWGVMKPGSDMSPLVKLIFIWTFFIGSGIGLLGGFIGSLFGSLMSRDPDFGIVWKNKMWWGISTGIILTPFWIYVTEEGSTSGGTYTPYGSPKFTGYPPRDTSPYLLPYDSNAVGSCYVGQANQGLWSHNFNNNQQLYAVDFSLDQGDEILAARPGTVVAFWETNPDDTQGSSTTLATTLAIAIPAGPAPPTVTLNSIPTGLAPVGQVSIFSGVNQEDIRYTSIAGNVLQGCTWPQAVARAGQVPAYGAGSAVQQIAPSWNVVVIRHDLDTPHAHDIGQGGAAVATLAVYGHGRNGSVSAAFLRHSPQVQTANILGTQVQRGEPIMFAGDTGISFHNHLHMHIVQDPGPPYGVFQSGNTIPFVFKDIDDDGVPWHFTWYTSGNSRVPPS